MQLGAALMALTWFGRVMVEGLARPVAAGLEAIGHVTRKTVTPGDITGMAFEMGAVLFVLVGPIAMASAIGGFASIGVQGGWNLSWAPLKLDPAKLSPMAGLRRLAPSRAG